VLARDGLLVSRSRFYGIDGYRYFDNDFPYLIYFEFLGPPEYVGETLVIQAILPATPSSSRRKGK
jgi:hypothetical protein